MNIKWLEGSLFLTILLSGLYGGVGFFTAMGGNPALEAMSDAGFAEFWQNVDHYMAARMPVFGPMLMLSLLLSLVLLIIARQVLSTWVMLAALFVIVSDLVFTLRTNHPLNQIIQSWDLKNLPSNVQEVKWKVINAFNIRMLFMMSAFILVLSSVWLREKKT